MAPLEHRRLPALKAARVLRLLARVGYTEVRRRGSHRKMVADGRGDIIFAYHDKVTIPPHVLRKMLVDVAGLTEDEIEDLL